MADYSSQTVAQLKEVLKSRDLPVDGKKADLIQRLVDNDEASQSEPTNEPPVQEEKSQEISESTEQPETVSAESESAADVPKEEEKPKTLSAEERKQLAVELLNKKIQRAEKFGDETSAEAARKDLSRVQKFGVELGTSLAREIGLVDDKLGNGHKKFFSKKGPKFKKNNKISKPRFNDKKTNYRRRN